MTLNDLKIFAPLVIEAESRPVRLSKPPILPYQAPARASAVLAEPGTVTVYVFRKDSEFKAKLLRSLLGGNAATNQLVADLNSQYKKRKQVSLQAAVQHLIEQPVFAELRYGARTLASSLFVPDGLDACVFALPYNGGGFSPDGFTLVEHVRSDGDKIQLEAVVVSNPTELTRAEKAALQLVSEDQLELNVGHNVEIMCYALCATALVVLVINATGLCGRSSRNTIKSMSDAEIRRLGPDLTARRLLELRRAAITSQ